MTIVRQTPRDDGKVDVTLTQDGVTFTITVPNEVVYGNEALATYQIMADAYCAEMRRLQAIIRPGQET